MRHALARSVARLLYPHGATRTVLRGPAKGTRFVVQRGTGVSFALGRDAGPRFFEGLVREGMTVWDVGANVGQTALVLAPLVGGPDGTEGRVVSFEPAPQPYEGLLDNLRVSGCPNVEPHRVALSDADGTAEFWFSETGTTAGKLAGVEPTKGLDNRYSVTVETARADTLLASGAVPVPDLIKIDVEGGGAAVLRGAAGLLEEHGPAVLIEQHGPEERQGIKDELLARGYVAETLGGERVQDPTAAWRNPLYCYRP